MKKRIIYYKGKSGTEFYTPIEAEDKEVYIPLKPFVILLAVLSTVAVVLLLGLQG